MTIYVSKPENAPQSERIVKSENNSEPEAISGSEGISAIEDASEPEAVSGSEGISRSEDVSELEDEIVPVPDAKLPDRVVPRPRTTFDASLRRKITENARRGQPNRPVPRKRRCWSRGRGRSLTAATWVHDTRPRLFSMDSLKSEDDLTSSDLSVATEKTVDEDAEKIVEELGLLQDRSRFDYMKPPEPEWVVIDRPTIKNFVARLRFLATFGCFRGEELVLY